MIELLVVIAVIGLLSTAAVVSIVGARAKARDTKRQHDIASIRKALFFYYNDNNNWMTTGSGCGSSGNGNGWFNYVGGAYPKSMSQCLIDNGYTKAEIIDPTGGRTCNAATGYAFMKYSCGSPVKTYIYAKMETINQSATATDGTCCPTCDSSYGMNYYAVIQ